MGERSWRLLRRTLLVLLLVAGLFHVAGGWYFAGQIGSDALAVTTDPVAQDLTVSSVQSARITMRDPGAPNTELRSSRVYGVVWKGGYGRISGAPTAHADQVTRGWTLLAGRPPARGTKASLDRFAFPLVPPASARVVRYRSPLGQLPATYFPGNGHTWTILVHGKGATRAETYRLATITSGLGMPTLSIGYRNDLGVAPDPSGHYGYGRTEWRDLQSAVAWATDRGATTFVLGGASMGGGIVASYLRHTRDTGQVRALVLDAPMLNLRDTIGFGASQRSLPGLGLSIPGTLTWVAEELASLRYGVRWSQVDYTSKPDWVRRRPTLIFHGTVDDTVPISTSRLIARESKRVRLVVVPGADHVESWNVDPAAYRSRVTAFLRAALR
ncbi:MAG: alpha/beta fold hydrolase [Marmoricola sp.]